jgi:hypothetical protein
MAAVIGRGAFGDLVVALQSGLARLGYYNDGIDGDFGGGTERAVQNLQADHRLPSTGTADTKTWKIATTTAWPDLFQRCLQVTARFEGHGYQTIAGNFDGAGLTWGIIGFTLKHGEVQAIVNEVQARNATLLVECFGAFTEQLLVRMNAPIDAALLDWADSISVGANKYSVQDVWRTGFAKLGASALVHDIQQQRARSKYFEPALVTSRLQKKNELTSDLGVALCFDIHVQNGGIGDDEMADYLRNLSKLGKKATDTDKRLALARVVADNSRAKYRDDVFARKSTLATGAGLVHGQMFKLINWGLTDQTRRTKDE